MGWISVKDRLPERDVDVLVYSDIYCEGHFKIRIASIGYIDTEGDINWQDQDDDYWGNDDNVTHWMPLPNPPRSTDEMDC